jgi:hypothetical protein
MKIKVNDLIKNQVTLSGKQKKNIADDIGISRNQLNNILAEPNMEVKYVLSIGKSIRHDFTKDLPDLAKFVTDDVEVEYDRASVKELKDELLEMHRKYTKLQDDYINSLKELLECRKQLPNLA